jgi:hypothetical protein
MNIHVKKRSGEVVPLDISKIQRQVAYATAGIDNVRYNLLMA